MFITRVLKLCNLISNPFDVILVLLLGSHGAREKERMGIRYWKNPIVEGSQTRLAIVPPPGCGKLRITSRCSSQFTSALRKMIHRRGILMKFFFSWSTLDALSLIYFEIIHKCFANFLVFLWLVIMSCETSSEICNGVNAQLRYSSLKMQISLHWANRNVLLAFIWFIHELTALTFERLVDFSSAIAYFFGTASGENS